MPLRRLLLTALLLPTALLAQIESVTRVTAQPVRLGRLDFVVMLTADWTNPYRSDELRLDATFTAPSGRRQVVPGYFERGPSGRPSVWRLSYAPAEAGDYRGEFVLTRHGRADAPVPVAFAVAPSTARGFLHADGPWTFRFDDGTPFRGIGENLCWESRAFDDSKYFRELHENPRYHYDYMVGQLAANGGNFFRTWMCPWNLPLEWNRVIDTARYTDDDHPYNASAARRLDDLVELTAATDTYFMLTLDAHGAFLGKLWDLNPYNARNGGPAATPTEFFTLPAAKARYRDRLRYLVARWGWSPHLGVWEFFNEIDNAMYEQKPARIPDDVITAWHAEMSAYLKQVDPYGRPVTTSVSHRDVAGLNALPAIDFNQKHIYKHTDTIPGVIREYIRRDGKPYVIGEFGYEWDWSKNFNDFAPAMDRDYRLGLWLGLFSPTPILPMSWWWEFFDARHMTRYLAPVRAVHERMLAAGRGEFHEFAPGWTGRDTTVLGVQCGEAAFVLLLNSSAHPERGSLTLAAPGGHATSVARIDLETGQPLPLTPGEITLAPGEFAVFVASPDSH